MPSENDRGETNAWVFSLGEMVVGIRSSGAGSCWMAAAGLWRGEDLQGGEGRAPPERDPGASRETCCCQVVGWALSTDLTIVNFLDLLIPFCVM